MITNVYWKTETNIRLGAALEKGIFYLKKGDQSFQEFQIRDSTLLDYNNRLYVDEERILAYKNHFSIINRATGEGDEYSKEIARLKNFGLQEKLFLTDVCKDLSGVYWLSGNLLKNLEFDLVEHISQGGNKFCNNWKCPVRKIIEDEKGNIIFGSSHHVLQYNPQTTVVDTLACDKSIDVWDAWGLTLERPFLYVDNRRINLDNCSFYYIIGDAKKPTLNALDGEGNLWLGAESTTIWIYNMETETVRPFYTLRDILGDKPVFLRSVFPRKKGPGMWVLTGNNGLFLLHLEDGVLAHYTYDPEDENSMASSQLYDVYETEAGNLWIGSSMGLTRLETATNTFTHYKTEDGLPASKVYSILPESDEGLWLGTAYGISFLDFSSQTFFNFSRENGLGNTEYNTHAAYRSKAGKIYFGGLDGIDAFYAKDFLKPDISRSMPIIITQFNRFNDELEQLNSSDLQGLDRINLKPANKYFELYFKLADYRRNAENLYSYKMEGYDENWSAPGRQNFLRYENIPAGSYTLRVKAAITPTVWNEREIKISVIKAQYWYKTRLAYAFYVFTFLCLSYGLYQFLLNQRMKAAETRQLKEMDALKTKLYTNITHEFRTPLTVIQGMADQIENHPQKARQLIRRNSKHLLKLVTQLLDMSKLESNKMQLELAHGDIVAYLQYLAQSFESYAQAKGIQVRFYSEVEELPMDFDQQKLQHIVSNLLSNAIKFTPDNGRVRLEVAKVNGLATAKPAEMLQIIVHDNGIGISKEELPYIFDRFYQVDNSSIRQGEGTGIGLALTQELLKLMEGTISVESEPDKGSVFTVRLPIRNAGLTKGTAPEYATPESSRMVVANDVEQESVSQADGEWPILLLVEDNADVASYIQTCLEGQYQIHCARDGVEGVKKALALIPDIIISDVMMPGKNGYEVTRTLKNDERTSHIPIILLTAKADLDSKLEGLERGADAYLSKPFDKKELLVRIQKLIELRRNMQARFAKLLPTDSSITVETQVEDRFLKKVRNIITGQLENPQFGVALLCQELGISQPQLYRKIKALTNTSTAGYIKTVRLHKARALLQSSGLTVAEVAYKVGYSDPSYFTKSFSSEFGYLPSKLAGRE